MKHRALIFLTEALLYLLAAFVLFCMVMLFTSDRAAALICRFYEGSADLARFYGFLVAVGCLALWILFELLLVLRTVPGDPFVERNVKAFVRMGLVAEAAGILFAVQCALFFTPMMAVCGVVMVLSGLFALVLSQVFRRAVEFKQENDLTI